MSYSFVIPIRPVAKGRARFSSLTGKAFTPSKTRRAEQDIRYYLSREWKREPLTCALAMTVVFNFIRPKSVSEKKRQYMVVKPDSSNCLKLVEDAGNGLLWRDDSQLITVVINKRYASEDSIILTVEEIS